MQVSQVSGAVMSIVGALLVLVGLFQKLTQSLPVVTGVPHASAFIGGFGVLLVVVGGVIALRPIKSGA
jgi:hypothetical protein